MDNINIPANSGDQMTDAPLERTDRNIWKLTTLILFILLILSAVFIAYLLKSKPSSAIKKQNEVTVISSAPSPSLPADETANWKIYNDSQGQISFKYPATYKIEQPHIYPYLNRNITWRFDNISIMDCRGDCPAIELKENKTIDGKPATRVSGYIGSIGGNIPQNYVTYEIPINGKYFVFTIQALPFEMTPEETELYDALKRYSIKPGDESVFDKIAATLKFPDNATNSPFEIIINLTKPMQWSSPQDSSMQNAQGTVLEGKSIKASVSDKIYDKMARYMVTEGMPLIDQYHWVPVMEGFADGAGHSIATFKAEGKTVIIRLDDGVYTVFEEK